MCRAGDFVDVHTHYFTYLSLVFFYPGSTSAVFRFALQLLLPKLLNAPSPRPGF
jgi:hypothetical protein